MSLFSGEIIALCRGWGTAKLGQAQREEKELAEGRA